MPDTALAINRAGDIRLPVTAAAKGFLDVACAAGFSDADFASVAQALRLGTPEPGGVGPASWPRRRAPHWDHLVAGGKDVIASTI